MLHTGLVLPPGHGDQDSARPLQVTFKVTGAHSRNLTVLECPVAPGFDVGAHLHRELEECFYVLDGELEMFAFEPAQRTGEDWTNWEAADGQRPVRASAGACMFVPPGCPHAFRNIGKVPARLLCIACPPPIHENYLKAMSAVLAANPEASPQVIARVREAHDTHQITPMKYPAVPDH